MSDVTKLLEAAGAGDRSALEGLLPLVYQELRGMARQRMAQERAEHTLQPTALVHEAYLRLVGSGQIRWDGRGHFFSAAAEAMRRILIEHARKRKALKSGGGRQRVELDDDFIGAIALPCSDPDALLALDEALDRLAKDDPQRGELVKFLYFAGLTLEETAAALGISRTAAHRQWVFTRAWLHHAIVGNNMLGEIKSTSPVASD